MTRRSQPRWRKQGDSSQSAKMALVWGLPRSHTTSLASLSSQQLVTPRETCCTKISLQINQYKVGQSQRFCNCSRMDGYFINHYMTREKDLGEVSGWCIKGRCIKIKQGTIYLCVVSVVVTQNQLVINRHAQGDRF